MRLLHGSLKLLTALCVLSPTYLLPARADTVDYSSGFAGATGLQLNGNTAVVSNRLQLTDGRLGRSGTAFTANPVNITRFHAAYDFQLAPGIDTPSLPTADGITFTIQNAGPYAVGDGGGGLAYGGVPRSVAVKYDLYDNGGEGTNSTGLFKNGEGPGLNAFTVNLDGTGIDLHSNHVLHVVMDYDGTTLQTTITDPTAHVSASQSYAVDIPGTVGSASAYVGFTGATGGLTAVQTILDFSLTSPQARIIRVSPSGSDANDGSTWALAKRNIQAALNSAASGDQVWVAQGTYFEHIGINPGVELYGGFAGTETTLLQRVIGLTTVNGGGGGLLVYLPAGGAPQKINGFTLTNGDAGIIIADTGSPVISQNAIVNNNGAIHGTWCAGISGYNSNAVITNNYVAGNAGIGDGGGILLGDAHPVIYGNTITGNTAGRYSGGIHIWHNGSPFVASNSITNNTAKVAEGGMSVSGSPTIRSNYVANNNGNTARNGGTGGISVYGASNIQVLGNYIASNRGYNAGGLLISNSTNVQCAYNTLIGNAGDFTNGVGGLVVSVSVNVPVFNNLIDSNSGVIGGVQNYNTSGDFTGNTVQNNHGGFAGGFRLVGDASANIGVLRNRFLNNLSDNVSGAIETAAPNPLIANNLMAGNQAVYGAAMGVAQATSPRIFNNTIVGNKAAGNIGGINVYRSSPIIANNIIAYNTSGGIGQSADAANPSIHHNDIFGNTIYDIAGNVTGVTGNVSVNPQFVNRASGDYHLLGTSPVIDAGDDSLVDVNDTDLDGLARILNAHVDMGAFEYPFAHDVTALVMVQAGGFRLNRANKHFTQVITLTNTGRNALSGPISLVLDNLSANAALVNKRGITSATSPAGSPYADFPTLSLAPGAQTQITLDFTDPSQSAITYKIRVLAGPASR